MIEKILVYLPCIFCIDDGKVEGWKNNDKYHLFGREEKWDDGKIVIYMSWLLCPLHGI